MDQQPRSTWSVFIGTLCALLVAGAIGWFIYSASTSNDDADCALDQAERSLNGLPPADC